MPQSTTRPERLELVARQTTRQVQGVRELLDLASRGLPTMWRPERSAFAHTARAARTPNGPELRLEGTNLRYTAIAALGASTLEEAEQRRVLAGSTAAELATVIAAHAAGNDEPGAVALAAWASAEAGRDPNSALFRSLGHTIRAPDPLPTVVCSWMLSAALAAPSSPDAPSIIDAARERLLAAQGPEGVFPHVLPPSSVGPLRRHVGCFADQVYPIQALARLAAARSDEPALAAANLTAARICGLQGQSGQWWWHYDVRDGSVVEGYPVYSVHQHAMAPMALLELLEAGGGDHRDSVARGLDWLWGHPEVVEELISERLGVIWRKVGRAEPAKAVRKISAASTALRAGLHVPGLDRVFPPTRVDYECRPYEFGWLLYAWLASGVVRALAVDRGRAHA